MDEIHDYEFGAQGNYTSNLGNFLGSLFLEHGQSSLAGMARLFSFVL